MQWQQITLIRNDGDHILRCLTGKALVMSVSANRGMGCRFWASEALSRMTTAVISIRLSRERVSARGCTVDRFRGVYSLFLLFLDAISNDRLPLPHTLASKRQYGRRSCLIASRRYSCHQPAGNVPFNGSLARILTFLAERTSSCCRRS